MLNISLIKKQIKNVIVKKLSPISGLNSITFVGSFETSNDISLISDIDIIVIVDKLHIHVFKEIEITANSINGIDFGLEGYNVKLNMTFGPLKFNNEQTVVLHIMVYDIEGHRKHVLESPFTCLDWEYFPAVYGKNLSDIYPSKGVQLEDLVGSRRGLESYLDDLKNQTITYREYDFTTNPYTEKRNIYPIDDRHQKEYSYHILKFLQLNLIKILFQENKKYSITELTSIFSTLKASFKVHSEFLLELHNWKYNNGVVPDKILERLEKFINDLSEWLNTLDLPQISFFRHGKTKLNDSSFLGVKRDPPILKEYDYFYQDHFDEVYTSSLKRAFESGKLLSYDKLYQDALLDEIDYGLAEGLTIDELAIKFPNLIQSWKNNEDPKFPEGENQIDVQKRLNTFLRNKILKGRTAIVTHNVVLRTLLGQVYNQPVHKWFRTNPKHFEAYNFQIFNNILIPKLTKEQQKKTKDEFVGFKKSVAKFGLFWIPNDGLCQYIQSWKDRFRQLEPDAAYLEHPIHCTIFLFNGFEEDQSEIISKVNYSKINFSLDDWKIFENDIVTKADTIAVGLKPSKIASEFQLNVANSLLNNVIEPIHYENNWEGEYNDSFQKYGFPFVGKHWIPHLTIASVKKGGRALIEEAKFKPISINNKKLEGHISLFKISGELHEHIYTWI